MAHSTIARPEVLISTAVLQRFNPKPELTICCYQSPESRWGACDAVPCYSLATVHNLDDDLDYCASHFQAVSRG